MAQRATATAAAARIAALTAMPGAAHFQKPVLEFARTDFPKLHAGMSVADSLRVIREHGVGERIIYFYVVDETERLCGVLPKIGRAHV